MMDASERALLDSTVNRLVAASDGAALTASLDSFGWREMMATTPEVAVPILFTALWRSNHWTSALHDVMSRTLVERTWGTETSAVVVPLPRRVTAGCATPDGVRVGGLLVQARVGTSLVLAVCGDDGVDAVVEVPQDQMRVKSVTGLDPSLGALSVTGVSRTFTVLADGPEAAQWWEETVARARIAICYTLVGSMQRMIEFASEHASHRRQFGRPVGTFQAVRHRLAEALVASVAAESLVAEVRRSDIEPLAAATAKLVTSNAVKVVTGHVQQVLAGVGFTSEHEFHRFFKRAIVLDRLFGGSNELTVSIGLELVRLGVAPRLFEL